MDPFAASLEAAEAVLVGPGEFRALDENASLLRPLVGRGFQVSGPQGRAARNGKLRHEWRLGARLGPNASGIHPQKVPDVDATSPGIRKAGFRGVMEVLRCPGQVGYPPGVATDAQLGFSVKAYQSAEAFSAAAKGAGAKWRDLRDRERGPIREVNRET